MADDISTKFGNDIEIELIPSSGGVFEVSLDGQLLFSKQKTGRFPEQKEVDEMMATIASKK